MKEVFPGIYQITMPTPFAVGDVHAYLLWGEPLTLVDTGLYYPPSQRALTAALAEVGVAPSDLEQIVLTHSHLDHFGQARWLQQAGGATVLAHPTACAKIADLSAFVNHAIAWAGGMLTAAGLPEDHHSLVHTFYGIIPQLAQNVTVQRCLDQGDALEAGGQQWQVHFFPGHAGDLITLWQPETGILLGNDHLLAHISSNALLEPPRPGERDRRRPLIQYWDSLDRLEVLPVTSILPGHGPVISDHRSLLAERRDRRDRRLARIEALVAESPHSVWEIAGTLFPKLDQADIFLGISEVVGHLDMLLAQNRVSVVEDEGPVSSLASLYPAPATLFPRLYTAATGFVP